MGAPQQFPAVGDVFPHFAHLYCAMASHLLPLLVLYFVKVSWFLTDFTPGTPRAISEALALAPMVGT